MTDALHPAVAANMKSIELASNKDREGWLALYADDAILQDPVGKSPFDPTGKGHIGKEAIGKFYDMVIGQSNLKMTVQKRITSGDRAVAVFQTADNELNGMKFQVEMVAIYEVNDEGKIQRMSAYWSWDDMQKQLGM